VSLRRLPKTPCIVGYGVVLRVTLVRTTGIRTTGIRTTGILRDLEQPDRLQRRPRVRGLRSMHVLVYVLIALCP
jgi:hypothetical protein